MTIQLQTAEIASLPCLNAEFERLSARLIAENLPNGFDVMPNAPQTMETLAAHYASTGKIAVRNFPSPGTVWSDLHLYRGWRAYHDLRHLTANGAFTIAGEHQVWRAHMADYERAGYSGRVLDYFGELTRVEIISQNVFYLLNPAEQSIPDLRAFAEGVLTSRKVRTPRELIAS